MTTRWIIRLGIVLVALGYGVPVSAGALGEFLSGMARDTKRRNCWPDPFIVPDRHMQQQPFAAQVNAGWERQNLLSDFHFTPGGNQLTEAGRLRVQWIMTEAPEQHRQIYVHRAATPNETAARVLAAQQFASQSTYNGQVPQVIETSRTDDGWPADRVDAVSKKSAAAIPEPKLFGGAGSSGGGGSGH